MGTWSPKGTGPLGRGARRGRDAGAGGHAPRATAARAPATVGRSRDPGPPVPDPDALEQAWQRLAKADELVQAFADRGWITDEARTVVEARTADLARRVGRVQQRASSTEDPGLADEVGELTALLVALSDAAVEAQPSLAPDTPVPVGIEQAQQRRGSTLRAYDDLP